MKILQICTDLRLGGIQRFVLDLCQELGKQHEVVLLTTWSESTDELKIENPIFRRFSLGKTKGGFSLRLMWQVCRIIWKERPDVVHTHYFTLAYSFPMVYFHLPRETRFVHTVHSMADKEGMGPHDMFRKLTYGKKTIPAAISSKVQKSIVQMFPGIKSPLVFNGISLQNFSESELELQINIGKKVFVSIGNISENKNQIMLNSVARRLEKEGYDFKVYIFGRNDDPEYFERFQQAQCRSVVYCGPTKNPCRYLKQADFFVLSSTYEGMPISLIEAIGCGCVPVCTPAGGIPDACIHHQTGLLAAEISEEALYQTMKEALELPADLYSQYKANCLALYQECFTMEKCAKAYEKVYTGKNL